MKSKLWQIVSAKEGHEGVRLGPQDLDRLVTWMDTYATRQGSFCPIQEEQLRTLRTTWAGLLKQE
jgi:hypothetical protein